ncbi:MAG TPA: VWA domain-containing protein [Pyrinomonadaceae bacterium]|nr:VWA domain-containing protein [Pyrinomonadaceae bacterium]
MSPYNKPISILLAAVASLLLYTQAATAQEITSQPQEDTDEVVKISTQLVQTSVSVQDKKGRFVDGLKKEDFELKVDGRAVEVSFFERVMAGTNEEAQKTAINAAAPSTTPSAARPLARGRIVAFFIDDMHISAGNLKKAKEAISKYIEKEMGPNDLVAITSASGQIGFLQQYTDNKDVLRAALARLNYKNFDVNDVQIPIISYYQAIQVDRGDRATLTFLADETLRSGIIPSGPGGQITEGSRALAEENVKQRVGFILKQGTRLLLNTLSTLESLIRYSAPIPGRKLVFLISDGFFLDSRNGNVPDKLRSITDASTRSGVVIYSMDAKGLVTGMEDPRVGDTFDPFGMAARSSGGELGATQDGLNALAVDTGGRFIRNTNGLDASLSDILKETSVYYMLAWRPETDPQRSGKFRRIEVDVKNRPELSVRVQRGYFENAAPATTTTASTEKPKKSDKKSKKAAPPADPLTKALVSRYPQKQLPTELTLSYMDAPNTATTQLVASMKIEGSRVRFETGNAKSGGIIDIEGVVFDAQGKRMDGFRTRLIAQPPGSNVTDPRLPDVTYNYYSSLKPGLYQVRVASRYDANGLLGSAVQWVEIPDLSKQRLSLSSLMLGEKKSAPEQEKKPEAEAAAAMTETVPISVDRRFDRSSSLRFLVYIYNAAREAAASQPQVELQVQILRDEKPVATSPMRKISTAEQDMTRLAYAAEFPLQEMTAGQYILQVTAIDRIAKTTASQRVRFEVH